MSVLCCGWPGPCLKVRLQDKREPGSNKRGKRASPGPQLCFRLARRPGGCAMGVGEPGGFHPNAWGLAC